MRDELPDWLGGLEMPKGADDGDTPILTEPEIIRVLAVGGTHIRTVAGWIYVDAWEQLSSENRVGARLAMTPQGSLEMYTELGKVLTQLGLIARPAKKN